MKTAFLLGIIGSGLLLLNSIFSFVSYIVSYSQYATSPYYVQATVSIIAWVLIFVCFIIAYQKQNNNRSWKD